MARVTSSDLEAVAQLAATVDTVPHIDSTFPLDRAGDTIRYLMQRSPAGKVVLIP